jgi:hypothetical protein
MVNPSQMQRLSQEYERDLRENARPRGVSRPAHRNLRNRLGRSLVSLGERLAQDPLIGVAAAQRRDARGRRPVHSWS